MRRTGARQHWLERMSRNTFTSYVTLRTTGKNIMVGVVLTAVATVAQLNIDNSIS